MKISKVKKGGVPRIIGRLHGRIAQDHLNMVTMALDQAEAKGSDDPALAVAEYLKKRLNPDDMARVISALQEVYRTNLGEDDAVENPSGVRAGECGGAMQPGSEFSKRDRLGQDADPFPHANRLLVNNWGVQPQKKPTRQSAAAKAEYENRFPHSRRLG